MRQENKKVIRVDELAYQEFIFCPYCNHLHTHIPGWENWSPRFKVICHNCRKMFDVRLVNLVIYELQTDTQIFVWFGIGFDSERDDNCLYNRDLERDFFGSFGQRLNRRD